MTEVKARLGRLEAKFDTLDANVDALPRVLAEMLNERDKRR
jgi:hypothetical protein